MILNWKAFLNTLWLGLDPPQNPEFVHYPMIRIVPLDCPSILPFTHLIVTSKTAVDLLPELSRGVSVIAVGKQTERIARSRGFSRITTAENECAEGVIEILKTLDPTQCTLFYPHSKKSRPLIEDYLKSGNFSFQTVDLYDVVYQAPDPIPNLEKFRSIYFTSPSTVDSFFNTFKSIPSHLILECIGSVTRDYLTKKINQSTVKLYEKVY